MPSPRQCNGQVSGKFGRHVTGRGIQIPAQQPRVVRVAARGAIDLLDQALVGSAAEQVRQLCFGPAPIERADRKMVHVRETQHVGKPTVNRVAVRKVGVPDSDQDGESAVAWTSQHVQDHVTQTRVGPLEVVDQHDQRRLTYDVLHPVVDRPDRVSCVDASQAGAGEVLGRR
jgi:hypothetical protein